MATTKKFKFTFKNGDPVMVEADTRMSAIREMAKMLGFSSLAELADENQTSTDALYDMVPTTIIEEFDDLSFKPKRMNWMVPFLDKIENLSNHYERVKSSIDDEINDANEAIDGLFSNINSKVRDLNERIDALEELRSEIESAIEKELERDDLTVNDRLSLRQLYDKWTNVLENVPEFSTPKEIPCIEDVVSDMDADDPLNSFKYPRRP